MDVQRRAGSSSKEIWPWSCDVFVLNFITEDNRSFVEDLRNALHRNGIVTASQDSIAQAPMDKYKLCVFIISKNCEAQPYYLEKSLEGCVNFLPIFLEPAFFQVYWGSYLGKWVLRRSTTALAVRDKSGRLQIIGNILEKHIDNILREKRARISSLYDAKKIDISGEIATVGIGHDRVEKLIEILKLGSKDDVRVVGISGMGGVGKTALAGDVYNKISRRFDSAYFISIPSNKDMLKEAFLRIAFPEEFEPQYSKSLRLYKILVVFDDVEQQGLLDEGWIRGLFGGRSGIIITSRDEELLRYLGVDEIHKVELLNQKEALRLFCKIVFKSNKPMRGYEELTFDALKFADGLPLAIKSVSSSLVSPSVSEWKSVLTKLQTDLDFSIITVLQKSFDGLSFEQRKAFLDIACCFAGQRTD